MNTLEYPFSDAFIAKRVKVFDEHPTKGLFRITQSSGDLPEYFYNGGFQITKTSEKVKKKIKYFTGLSLMSRTKDTIYFSSAIFLRKKPLPVFFVKNLIGENGVGDFFLISKLNDDEVEMLLSKDRSWDDIKKILRNWARGKYNNHIEELFAKLKPVHWDNNKKGGE